MNNIECKIVTHLSEREVGEDIHLVKEVYEDENGEIKDRINIIKNFKRPFWITKEMYRTYSDKKETEDIKKLNKYYSTESNLYREISKRLGDRYINMYQPRILKKSPYLYGSDVDSRTILKYAYQKKHGENARAYRVGVFDIEVDTLTNKIILITIVTYKECRTVALKEFADKIPDLNNRLRKSSLDNIPDVSFKDDVLNNFHFEVFDNEIDMIKYIFHHANYMDIDFLTGWNIKYDLTEIIERLETNNVDIASVFHYEKIPSEYRYFKFKEGRSKKITEAGREIPLPPEEQWHTVKSSTNYYFIDAMSTHRYVRVGGATVPGGYSLDNILKKEGIEGKLKFESNSGFKGIEWHIYMVAKKPLEYIVYNIWDCMSILDLDAKTKDLAVSTPLLSGISHFDVFNSGPKKLVDAIFFFFLDYGKVLGVKDPNEDNNKILGLDGWVNK